MKMKKRVFTLIELLAVITVIAILAGILLPAMGRARKKARSIECTANLKQISTAFLMYVNDSNDWIPTWQQAYDGPQWTRWYSLLNVYLKPKLNPDQHSINKLMFCPSITWGRTGGFGGTGEYFGYGANLYVYEPVNGAVNEKSMSRRISKFPNPSSTLLFGDNAVSNEGQAPSFSNRAALYYPDTDVTIEVGGAGTETDGQLNRTKHSNSKNVVWVDGHVTTESIKELQKNYDDGRRWWNPDA